MMSRPEGEYADLVKAYQNAEYRVIGEYPFTLRIGVRSEELANVMAATGAKTVAVITADNPYSFKRDSKENSEARATLQIRLTDHVETLVPAIGVDPSGAWPGEEGYLALDLSFGWAKAIACMFGQNAFVFAEADAVPTLVLLSRGQQ